MENQEKEITTEQDIRKTPGWNPNPTGKGGFAEHPENRSPGGWDKNNTFSYWMNYFKSITVPEFEKYEKENHDTMTMSCLAAYARVGKMVKDLTEFQVVANRTEGMPKQSIEYGVDETIGEIEVKIKKHETNP
jgi:hypothetical protein